MDGINSLSLVSNALINPLKKESNMTPLKTFEEVIQTCIGPHGRLKVVHNIAGGYVTVTSSSQRLLNIVSIKNIFLKLIISSAKVHLNSFCDSGLTCLLLILKLVNNSLSSICPLPLMGKLFEQFGKLFVGFLTAERNSCVINMDMSNLTSFQCVIRTILQSKPGCILSEDDIKHLCLLLMKVHLNSIPITLTTLYYKNINFVTLEGASFKESQLFEGLLVKLPEMPAKKVPGLKNKSNIKVILFTTSLSGDADFPVDIIEVDGGVSIWETVLNFLKCAIQKIIQSEVDILACQKVVHPSLRKLLEDANILVLDRLGFEMAKHFEYISGSSNSSLFSDFSFGSLTSVSKETIGKSEFLLLSNNLKSFYTMLICSYNEQAVNETKVVCQQVIDALFRLLKKPVLCCGAGCTEIYTCKLVQKKVTETIGAIKKEIGCTTPQVFEALHIFQKSVTDLAVSIHQGSTLNFTTETVHNHLWKLQDDEFPSKNCTCACGKFYADSINNSSWCLLTKTLSDLVLDYDSCVIETKESVNRSVILDELSSKVNAYSVAFETASLLLRTSVCIRS